MDRFIVVEFQSHDSVEHVLYDGFSDVYQAGNTLQSGAEKLAWARTAYPSYNHALLEIVPVTIETDFTNNSNVTVATNGNVRVTAENR